jgi:putative GTP pyrophosphokinase
LRRARALYERQRLRYGQVLQAFHRRLRRILARHGFNPTIKYRVKSFDGYVRKLQQLQETSVEGIPTVVRDMLGVRVSAAFLEDVEHICDVITKELPINEIERKGGERAANAFGYESVHLIVRLPPDSLPSILPNTRRVCEIQLRTILQDAWAEVEHELVYGASLTLPHDSIKRKLASLSAMLGLSDLIFQEIRDGQKQLREHAASRRNILEDTIHSIHLDAISETSSALSIGRETGKTDTPTGSHVEELIIEALSAHGNRAFEKAIGIYSRLLTKKLEPPVRSVIYNHRGMAHLAEGRVRMSIHDFARALHFNSGNARAYYNRGVAHNALGAYERAIEDFGCSLAINPLLVEAHRGRALTYYELGSYGEALEECERVLALKPNDGAASALRKRLCATIEPSWPDVS